MNKALAALCVFTMLAMAWMFAMFLILRHPGFAGNAMISLLVIGQCMLTLAALRHANNLFAAAHHLVGITWRSGKIGGNRGRAGRFRRLLF